MSSSKKIHLKEDFAAVVYLYEDPSPLMTIYPPLQSILYLLIHKGKGVVMSKTKGQMYLYLFGNETNMFWYRSQISLIENRLYRFCPESALLGQIERISFDKTISGKNSIVFCFIPIKTFVELLWNVCAFTVLTLQEGGEYQREGYRGDNSQSWVVNTSMTDCTSSL
jgi:hypothetical protein